MRNSAQKLSPVRSAPLTDSGRNFAGAAVRSEGSPNRFMICTETSTNQSLTLSLKMLLWPHPVKMKEAMSITKGLHYLKESLCSKIWPE